MKADVAQIIHSWKKAHIGNAVHAVKECGAHRERWACSDGVMKEGTDAENISVYNFHEIVENNADIFIKTFLKNNEFDKNAANDILTQFDKRC